MGEHANRPLPTEDGTRSAFTLLEVVLALALSTLVLGALGFAIQLNLKATTAGRASVMQAQLARAILDRMSGDLRCAVWYKPPDTSAIMPLVAASTSGSAGSSSGSGSSSGGSSSGSSSSGSSGGSSSSSGGGASGGQGGGAGTGGGSRSGSGSGSGSGSSSSSSGGSSGSSGTSGSSGSGSSSSSSSSTSSEASSEEPTPPARFYGGTDWIEFDSTRLPNSATYGLPAGSGGVPSPVPAAIGDVRNVSWYFATSGASTGGFVAPQNASGLLRREADGAIARWAGETGGASLLDEAAEILAPEVVALQFSYFDGTQWLTEWDSDAEGGLPMVVEIAVALLDPSKPPPVQAFSFATPAAEQSGYLVYRQLVQLPMAPPASEESTSTESSESSTSSSSSSSASGSSGSGSSGSQGGQP